MRSAQRHGALWLLAVAILVTACSRGSGSEAAESTETGSTAPTETVTLTAGGERARAGIYGPLSEQGVVIVVAGESAGAWSGVAADLARNGYRVLLLAGDGEGVEPALIRAAGEALRGQGVQKTVYIGMGAAIAPLLASVTGRAAAVVALNPRPPVEATAVAGLDAPLLALASLGDGESSVLARRLYDAAPAGHVLALYPAKVSGAAIFTDGDTAEVKTVILDFLRDAFQPLTARAGAVRGHVEMALPSP